MGITRRSVVTATTGLVVLSTSDAVTKATIAAAIASITVCIGHKIDQATRCERGASAVQDRDDFSWRRRIFSATMVPRDTDYGSFSKTCSHLCRSNRTTAEVLIAFDRCSK